MEHIKNKKESKKLDIFEQMFYNINSYRKADEYVENTKEIQAHSI